MGMSMERGLLMLSQRPRLTPTSSATAMATPMVDIFMERGLLMLSQRPRLIPTSSTPPTDTMEDTMARGLLMLSQRPRLTPTTSMATDTQPMATATTERGLLMLS